MNEERLHLEFAVPDALTKMTQLITGPTGLAMRICTHENAIMCVVASADNELCSELGSSCGHPP